MYITNFFAVFLILGYTMVRASQWRVVGRSMISVCLEELDQRLLIVFCNTELQHARHLSVKSYTIPA